MKKIVALVLALALMLSAFAFAEKSEGVLTHAEYIATDISEGEVEVTIETYVQDKQSWWDNKATLYTQDEDGAYFIYNAVCSEEDYEKLVPGTKIRVTGKKTEWSGEIELAEGATFEIIEGEFIAEPLDVTALLASEELIDHQNELVSFKGMTVESYTFEDAGEVVDTGAACSYKWNGTGEDGDDLYFQLSLDGVKYTFTVESYLRGAGTEVYEAVKALNIGDVVDLEGYLYWYNGMNPHIIAVAPAEAAE